VERGGECIGIGDGCGFQQYCAIRNNYLIALDTFSVVLATRATASINNCARDPPPLTHTLHPKPPSIVYVACAPYASAISATRASAARAAIFDDCISGKGYVEDG